MVDPTTKTGINKSDPNRDRLLNRINELEKLLARKKKEVKPEKIPRLKAGTDGIPVLVKTIEEDNQQPAHTNTPEDDEFINGIADKIEQEVTRKLDKLIVSLKDNIINEVKAHLLKELQINKK